MVKTRHIKKFIRRYKKCIFLIPFVVIFLAGIYRVTAIPVDAQVQASVVWPIRSIDTMKTSRDNARTELNNLKYDIEIKKELTAIKKTGANYVAIDTPYDNEFLPYLTRWVNLARQLGLHVWFRGNWLSWEGWFGYPKNMTPDEHLDKNTNFIITHPGLFQDGDIFDPCPECENAGFWPQNSKNQDYRNFIQKQQQVTKDAFIKIGKQVITNYDSIIGGRAKDVLDQKTFNSLGNVVSIDHYFTDPQSMTDYVSYFLKNFHTKVLVSEFGAPIPSMNGNMTETQQADFIQNVLERMYEQGSNVIGLNYWVIKGGTTAILNDDDSPRKAEKVLTDYFTPEVVRGSVINTLGDAVKDVNIKTRDGFSKTETDNNGNYTLFIPPPRSVGIIAGGDNGYSASTVQIQIATSGSKIKQNFIISPTHPNFLYQLRLFLKKHNILDPIN